MATTFKIGEQVPYRGRTGIVVEAHPNDQGYGVLRREMNQRCSQGQWVSNLGRKGQGEPGDGGEMYRLEPVGDD